MLQRFADLGFRRSILFDKDRILGVEGNTKALHSKERFFFFSLPGAILGRKKGRIIRDTGVAEECDLMAVFQNIPESALDRKCGIMLVSEEIDCVVLRYFKQNIEKILAPQRRVGNNNK